MTKHTYGYEGQAYPVKPNDVWRIGEHWFYCRDWFTQGLDLSRFPKCQMAYIDPPWNNGNVRAFYTKAGKQHPAGDFTVFITSLFSLTRAVAGDCFVEAGKANVATLQVKLESMGADVLTVSPITYYKKHPCAVLQYIWHVDTSMETVDLVGLDDESTPGRAITGCSNPGDYVLDLCAGRGLTSRHAANWNRGSVNIELHPNRISAALARLSQQAGMPAQFVENRL